MTPTTRLYYDEPALDLARARVLSIEDGGKTVELDRTLFFPEGGGQPCDLGTVAGVELEAVEEDGGRIRHRLLRPLPAEPGSEVDLVLDRRRRRDHGDQHSAQHLLSGLLYRDEGIQTLSFHLGPESSTIDLDVGAFDETSMDRLEEGANLVIDRGTRYILHLCPPEDASGLPLRKLPPAGETALRIIEIAGLDFSPCCGTHVVDASCLGLVKILGAERYKGKTRLTFVAGIRARLLFRRVWASARGASKALSAPPDDLAPEAARIVSRLKDSASKSRALLGTLVRTEIELALAKTGGAGDRDVAGDPRVALIRLSESGGEGLPEALVALSTRGMAAVVVSAATLTAGVVETSGAKLSSELGVMASGLGGRGGGRGGTFRAAFPDVASLESFASGAFALLEASF